MYIKYDHSGLVIELDYRYNRTRIHRLYPEHNFFVEEHPSTQQGEECLARAISVKLRNTAKVAIVTHQPGDRYCSFSTYKPCEACHGKLLRKIGLDLW